METVKAMGEKKQSRRMSGRGDGSATILDLAEAAGVSIASVSRALNDSTKVSSALRRRVLRAADTLRYVPNAAARALASQSTYTIGAVVPTLENPSFAIGVEALQKRLAQNGYTLFVASSNYDLEQERRQVETLVTRGVDGIMLVGALHDPGLYDFLRQRKVPFVNTWVLSQDPKLPTIGFDNKKAAAEITDFLLDLGHKYFGVIAGLTKSNDRALERVKGIRQALRARGLMLTKECLIKRPYCIVDGQSAMRTLMQMNPRPSAVICGNDVLAFGAMLECQGQGISIPHHVSVVGFDDLDLASQLVPPLTTIRVPADEIGQAAADYLLAATAKDQDIRLPEIKTPLVVRGSAAAPSTARYMALAAKHPPNSG